MAIQIRRGAYANFVPGNLVPGELADVQSGDPNTTDGSALYICLSSGNVVRIPKATEVEDMIENKAEEVMASLITVSGAKLVIG